MSYQPPVMPGYSSQPPPVWPPEPPAPRKSRIVPILISALIALLAVAAILAFYLLRTDQAPASKTPARAVAASSKIIPGVAFRTINDTCRTSMPSYDIEDAGHTLILTVGGPNGMDSDTFQCVLNSLNVPAATRQHIDTTRALDGQQTDSWDDYTARWTYYPDDGLQMTIREA